jgi:hypothetical protein
MDVRTQRKWLVFWTCLCLALAGMIGAQAVLVDLDALVTYSIFQNGYAGPLTNGAVVYIVGSGDSAIDPMATHGTNLIAASVTGDDVILGTARIGDNVSSNGTFYVTVPYESTAVNYVYIRFFDFTNIPVTGLVYWGTSSNFFIGAPTLGVSTVNFNQNAPSSLVTTNYNNFVVIPEPSSANLLVLVAGMAWAMRASMKRRVKQAREGGGGEGTK